MEDLENQLEHNVAALFLKMSSILSISETALQEVINQLSHIHMLSQPLLHSSIRKILHTHCANVDHALVNKIAEVVTENNVLLKFTSDKGSLSTAKRRKSYISRKFPLVAPVEFLLEKDKKTIVYVPILKMIQTLLKNREILEKAMSHEATSSEEYKSYRDGASFKDNAFFNEERKVKDCSFLVF